MRTFINAGVLSIGLTGCATMFDGPHQPVMFHVNRPGVVMVDGSTIEQDRPVPLKRDVMHRVEVRALEPGCHDAAFYLRSGFNGKSMLNLLWGLGLIFPAAIGFGVDAMTGSIGRLDVPDKGVNVTLDCR